jgi:hypothetical protein
MSADDLRELLESTRKENAAAHDETRRHFDIVAERLDGKADTVVEALAAVDAKLDRETKDIREELRRGFSETQAISLALLEGSNALVELAVERLESPSH